MQRACLWYYTIITYYYVIITQGSIITHYYLLQSAELADDLGLGFRGHIKKKDKPNLKVGFNLPFCDHWGATMELLFQALCLSNFSLGEVAQ